MRCNGRRIKGAVNSITKTFFGLIAIAIHIIPREKSYYMPEHSTNNGLNEPKKWGITLQHTQDYVLKHFLQQLLFCMYYTLLGQSCTGRLFVSVFFCKKIAVWVSLYSKWYYKMLFRQNFIGF